MPSDRTASQPEWTDQRQLLVNALTSIANAVFITDETGKIIWINDAFPRLNGYTLEDAYGRTPAILQSGQQSESFYTDMWQTIGEGKVWHGEVVDQRKDGTLYTADEVITPLFGSNGTVAISLAGKLVDAVSRPFMLRGRKYEVGISIGVALYPEHGADPESLLNLADSAMYEAKRNGGNNFRVCHAETPHMH